MAPIKGSKHSEQHKLKISLGLKKAYNDGRKKATWKKSVSLRKGKKLTPEHRKKLSESHKGNPGFWAGKKGPERTLETRNKMSKSHEEHPERHWSWKGGITPKNMKIRRSLKAKLWREAVFTRDNWTCKKTGIYGGKLRAHHIKNFSDYPKLRFVVENGITLSAKAHIEFHKIYGTRNNNEEQLKEFLRG